MANKVDDLFGDVAVARGQLTEIQLLECKQELQKGSGDSLPSIAMRKGFLRVHDVQTILKSVSEMMLGEGESSTRAADSAPPREPKPAPFRDLPPETALEPALAETGDLYIPPPTGKLESDRIRELPGSDIHAYLGFAKQMGASDLHISSGAAPFLRLNGRIRQLQHPILTPEEGERILLPILGDRERKIFDETNDVDFAHQEEGIGRFRCNYFRHRKGVSGVFRVIGDKIPTLKELRLPKTLEKFTTIQQGIVLITGPAGCGKSSTMAALVDIINSKRKDHIVTVEDPIEYLFTSKKSNVTQRQVEVHTRSWGIALRAALREDPDVIMVGELRDLDTISTAVTAAETGHLVLGTLHTTNAARTVDRIIDIFPPKQQDQIRAMVSESIRGVICQQLVPTRDGKNVIPALEILIATPAVGNIIREKRTFQLVSIIQTGKLQGMRMMDDSIAQLLLKEVITREEAIFRAHDPKRFGTVRRVKRKPSEGASNHAQG